MKVNIYVRISPKGGRDGTERAAASLELQEELVREWCEKKGHKIKGVYRDLYKSGNDECREEVWKAINSLDKGEGLVVWRRDRLARSVFLAECFRRQLDRIGAHLLTVTNGVEKTTPEERLAQTILDAVAEYERKVIALRTSTVMQAKTRHGLVMSSRTPWGTARHPENPQQLVSAPEEYQLLLEIYNMRVRDQMTWPAIASLLNRRGQRFRGKSKFHRTSLRRALERWLDGRYPPDLVPIPPGYSRAAIDHSQDR